MTFDEILEQVVILLKRQGRVAYRALKMRFDLDDEYLEVLKEELIDAQRLASDEDGRILVWSGDVEGTSAAVLPPDQTAQQPDTQEARTPQVESPPPEPLTPDAERRQLTVMFCDLVGSTSLSAQLDPEDLREVVRAYQTTCAAAIQRFDGYIGRYMGDGLLVYFGYPWAHDDDALRAVRTGLAIVAAMPALNAQLRSRIAALQHCPLQVRVSIHTGLVVIETIGVGLAREHQALGATPNIAARLQSLGVPDTVVMSAATSHLVQGYFTCDDLGIHPLRGVPAPMQVYRVLQESGALSRLDIASTRGLTPLVGRESEVPLLLERWNLAKDGQ
ncbi:MAG: adenylate/guanylate cyclase domain-containing protein, partial [bacterium]|nr:adenylate/guanylate cyclase domain-containing protein [bacterium]